MIAALRVLVRRVAMSLDVPMIPRVCESRDFVFCSELEARRYASNATLVGQLCDSVHCWISHSQEVLQTVDSEFSELDRLRTLCGAHLHAVVSRLEVLTSFHCHFDRDEALAVKRVLNAHGDYAKLLQVVDETRVVLRTENGVLAELKQYTEMLSEYESQSDWEAVDVPSLLQAQFSALRALWICGPRLGRDHPNRFCALLSHVVGRVHAFACAAGSAAPSRIIDKPHDSMQVKRALLGAQNAIVALQEQFCTLQERLADVGSVPFSGLPAAAFDDLDDAFARLCVLLECSDVLRAQPHKAGSALSDPLVERDVMGPQMTVEVLLAATRALRDEEVAKPSEIVERIHNKASAAERAVAASIRAASSSHLIVTIKFDPPVVSVCGGPLHPECCAELARLAPKACTTVFHISDHGAVRAPPVFCATTDNVQTLTLLDSYCDEIARAAMHVTIFDVLERFGWAPIDALGSFDGGMEISTVVLGRSAM